MRRSLLVAVSGRIAGTKAARSGGELTRQRALPWTQTLAPHADAAAILAGRNCWVFRSTPLQINPFLRWNENLDLSALQSASRRFMSQFHSERKEPKEAAMPIATIKRNRMSERRK